MRAHVEKLSQSCLLTLCPNEQGCYPLAEALGQVLQSSHRSAWVDCRQVAALPADALLLLRHYAKRLWQRGGHLVLCHLPEAARAALAVDLSEPLAASMLDADQYGLACPQGSAS